MESGRLEADAGRRSRRRRAAGPGPLRRHIVLHSRRAWALAGAAVGLAFGGIILLGAPGRAQEPDRFIPFLPLLLPATLEEPAQLEVKSLPCGASVYVDGLYRGDTPLHLELSPGTYDVRVEMAGYQSFQRAVTLLAGHSLRLQSSLDAPLRRRGDTIFDPWSRGDGHGRHPQLRPFDF